ncbi:MAG: hypothetical protein AB1552_09055 [Nitrospirota bacterium]
MTIAEWLDEKEAEGIDVSQIELPADLTFDEAPEETIFFEEMNPCGFLCQGNHPFSTVERFGHWYLARGQDRKAGIHATGMEWRLLTKDKDLALRTAKSRIARTE